jgi:23S rRNA (uracil1939-C5)-methyltransferase
MHLEYSAQVQAKAQWVEHALSRLEDGPRAHIIGSEECWGWRNRVKFQVIGDQLGFFARGSHELVVVDNCPIAADGVNQVLALVSGRLKKAPIPKPAWIEILAGPDGPAFITLGFGQQTSPSPEAVNDWRQWAREHDLGGVHFLNGNRKRRWQPSRENGLVYFQKAGLKMRAYPGLFCQANFSTNQSLIKTVLESANGRGRALELYAGSGNFSLSLAQAGWQVLALEGQAQAVQACRFQAQVNDLSDSLEVRKLALGPGLERLVQDQEVFDLVVLDPPRAGAKGLMPQIAALNPRRVIYVSCHPAALARDAAHLIRYGYGFNSLTVVDMFPHTAQVESVLVLDRGA